MMSICFFSGFSEKFIPNALSTLSNDPILKIVDNKRRKLFFFFKQK